MSSEDYCEKTIGLLKELNPEQVETVQKIFASNSFSNPLISLKDLGNLAVALGGYQEHKFLGGSWCFSLPSASKDHYVVVTNSRFDHANIKAVKDFRFGLEQLGICGECLP